MNKRIRLTRKILELQTVGEGESYPHMSMLSHKKSVGDALTELQLLGYRLRHTVPPWQIARYDLEAGRTNCQYFSGWQPGDAIPEPDLPNGYKLRFLFVLDRNFRPDVEFGGNEWKWAENQIEREFVKGGFLYDTPEQLEEWLGGPR